MSGVATAVGLGTAAAGAYAARQSRSASENAANRMADASRFNPWNVTGDLGTVGFNGGEMRATLSPQQQQLQQYLTGAGQGFLGGLGNLASTGGIGSGLQNAYMQYLNNPGYQSQQGNILDPAAQLGAQAFSQAQQGNPFAGLQGQFGQQSSNILNTLDGDFNPQAAAGSYTNNLRAQAQPENQRAVNSTVQNLFNRGRLGSTGGAEVMGRLAEAQNQQDLGFQVAGQQYGGAEQSRLAGLAQNFGQQAGMLGSIGSNIQSNNYGNFGGLANLYSGVDTSLYNMDQTRINQRFQNAMNLFGMGNSNQMMMGQLGGSLINQGQGLNQNLMSLMGLGIDSGRASSAAGAAGSGMLPMVAQAQGNQANAYASMFGSALGSFGNYYQGRQQQQDISSGAAANGAWGNRPVKWNPDLYAS